MVKMGGTVIVEYLNTNNIREKFITAEKDDILIGGTKDDVFYFEKGAVLQGIVDGGNHEKGDTLDRLRHGKMI